MSRTHNILNNGRYLVEFIPGGIEVLFDGVAPVSDASHADLDVGIALPLHHAPHEVVLCYQALGLHQVDAQHSLWTEQGQAVLS